MGIAQLRCLGFAKFMEEKEVTQRVGVANYLSFLPLITELKQIGTN